MNYAVVIAVENYKDTAIRAVAYAEADAKAFAAVLTSLGFDAGNIHVLLSDKATKATIESLIPRIIASLTVDDTLYFFYAGHGFSTNGENYLTCVDTDVADLTGTSVKLQTLFKVLRYSKVQRIAMFLDACESGMAFDPSARSIFSHLATHELEEFFKGAEFHICFASCKAHEKSHSASSLEHGIWSYHLIEALSGNASAAINEGFVTAVTLQNYLSYQVPLTIRQTRTRPTLQTPWATGAMNREFVVADLRYVLKAREQETLAAAKEFRQALLKGTRTQAVRSLTGFQKRIHHVPDGHYAAAEAFIAKAALPDLEEHINSIFLKLKEGFRYKRKEITNSVTAGDGTIVTPDFEYRVSVKQDPDDSGVALWLYEVSNITNVEAIESATFETVLGPYLDTIEYELAMDFDLEEFIDLVEAREPDGVRLDYPADCSHCEVHLDDFDGVVVLTPGSVQVSGLSRTTPKALVASLFSAQRLLLEKHQLPALPLQSGNPKG